MRKKPISHRRREDVKCKEGCTRSLWAIHLVSGTLPESAELRECVRQQSQKAHGKGGAGEKIHYVRDNLTGKYQNVSGTPDRGRGGKINREHLSAVKPGVDWSRAAGCRHNVGWELLRRGERGRRGACPPRSRGILASDWALPKQGRICSVPLYRRVPWDAAFSLGFLWREKRLPHPCSLRATFHLSGITLNSLTVKEGAFLLSE